MQKFKHSSYDISGAKHSGFIESSDKASAFSALKDQGLIPVELELHKAKGKSLFGFGNRVTLSDLEFLTSELSLLLASGVRIDKGLEIIQKNKAKPVLAELLSDIILDLKGGESLSHSLRQHPEVFPGLYCNLIELGESSGNLAEVFADLAKDLKFKQELQRKIVGALTYPLVILFVCILSILFVFNFIIPRMSSMFDGVDNLPWYTQALLSASAWLNQYQGLLFLGLIALGAAGYALFKNPEIKARVQNWALRMPIAGNAILTVERIRFNSGLSLMLGAGLAIDKAMDLCIGNVTNQALAKELTIAKNKVKHGSLLSAALSQCRIYPGFFISLIEVGEESGNLETVFDEIASRSRQEFESWAEKMTTLLEPLMILFMGGMVGGIVIIMLLSMISVNDFNF